MTRYLIIDDEFIAHDIIKGYADLLPKLQLMKSCYDALEALEYLNQHEVDLLFLDLNMPKLKGFEFLRTLPSPPKVIVTTAYSEFAIEGYELNIVDYLLKPFSFQRFLQAVNKAVNQQSEKPRITLPSEGQKTIFLKSNKKHIQVNPADILFLEAAGNYSKVITAAASIMVREKVTDLLQRLPPEDFLQVHKSYAVAVKHIASIEGNRIRIDQHEVPVGKMYKLNVINLLQG